MNPTIKAKLEELARKPHWFGRVEIVYRDSDPISLHVTEQTKLYNGSTHDNDHPNR